MILMKVSQHAYDMIHYISGLFGYFYVCEIYVNLIWYLYLFMLNKFCLSLSLSLKPQWVTDFLIWTCWQVYPGIQWEYWHPRWLMSPSWWLLADSINGGEWYWHFKLAVNIRGRFVCIGSLYLLGYLTSTVSELAGVVWFAATVLASLVVNVSIMVAMNGNDKWHYDLATMIKFMGYYILILIPWMNLLRFFRCQIDGLLQERFNSSASAIVFKFGFNQPYFFFHMCPIDV